MWIFPQSTEGNEVFSSDDVLEISSSVTNYLQATFNGVTLVSTQLLEFGKWYFIKFTQDGIGNGKIYVGDLTNEPTLITSGAVGLPVATTTTYELSR
jgi:hypothetical protein